MYKFCFLFIFWVIPQSLFAIPSSIARIVRTFEGRNKQKGAKPKRDQAKVLSADGAVDHPQAADPPMRSNAAQARLAIDEAIKDKKLASHPATWYYRGVIYDRLLRDHTDQTATLLNEALAAYAQAKQLSLSKNKQFYHFALSNLSALWHYFLNRGIGYYKQEAVDQAIEQFAICRRILPEDPTPLLYTAIVYHSADQPEEALRYYQDYVAVKGPQFAVARAMAAIYYYKFKNFDKAIAILNDALLQFPCNNELLEEICLIYKDAGRIDDYATSLSVGIQYKKINTYYAYGYLLEHLGRMEEAIAYYQQVLEVQPHQYDTLRQMGFLFYNEAIKLYAHARKSVAQKQELAKPLVADWCGVMHVTVCYLLPHAMGWVHCPLPVGLFLRSFVASPIWMIYDHPLVKHSRASGLVHLVQTSSLPYTSPLYGYIHTKNATVLAHDKRVQTIAAIEKCLQKALYYLKIACVQDKKDQSVAQALYYSYYHLKKYGSAYRLLQAMKKQHLGDDPFVNYQDKE